MGEIRSWIYDRENLMVVHIHRVISEQLSSTDTGQCSKCYGIRTSISVATLMQLARMPGSQGSTS